MIKFVHLAIALLSVLPLTVFAGSEKLSGRSAVILASELNDLGLLTQAKWGLKPSPSDSRNFFAGVFVGTQCAKAEFTMLDVKLQAGLIRCQEDSKAVWDISCVLQGRGEMVNEKGKMVSKSGKMVSKSGKEAYRILSLLAEAGAKPKILKNYAVTEVPSVECVFKGWEVCQGKGFCEFP